MEPKQPYTRPELTQDEANRAQEYAQGMLRKYGIAKAVTVIAVMAMENMKLVKEIQEHRAALGYEPFPEYRV